MASEQLAQRGVRDARVLDAFRRVPRHCFLPPSLWDMAYDDSPLPIGQGQTISQPYIVGFMLSVLSLSGSETVLEVGTGSGYQSALLSQLARLVYSAERVAELAERARITLLGLGYTNVHISTGDGTLGLPVAAPFEAIIVSAASPAPPPPLLEQLAPGGRMVIPIGGRNGQLLQLWRRGRDGYSHDALVPVAFVPLIGAFGWKEEAWATSAPGEDTP
jgi:protein-L-isoaspartate(D-aspartate) O-methyltransferase